MYISRSETSAVDLTKLFDNATDYTCTVYVRYDDAVGESYGSA